MHAMVQDKGKLCMAETSHGRPVSKELSPMMQEYSNIRGERLSKEQCEKSDIPCDQPTMY